MNDFKETTDKELQRLFQEARKHDELAFLFTVLGINSGMEDAGWQPIGETQTLVNDLVGLINSPLNDNTKVRLGLLLYCHIIEANFLYHCLYNLFLTIEKQPPKLFSFLDKYQGGKPPTVSSKISEIKKKATDNGFQSIVDIFEEIIKPNIRNAFFHSDYILYNGELRLKHRGSEYSRIPIAEVMNLAQNTMDFFNSFMEHLMEARCSFPKGYKITGRKNADGQNLASIDVLVDEKTGMAIGFSQSDLLPTW